MIIEREKNVVLCVLCPESVEKNRSPTRFDVASKYT